MPDGKPNILVIWGDDIGISNLSCYSDGLMGYRTPNIDRIADEGVRFTDYYGEQSCTAGRAAFICGQNPIRTGLTKVGMPGADIGLRRRGPDHRHRAQGAGLRHRPVRQEPPGRPRRVPAHRPRLRRVLRQPLPPQRRGGARARRLPDARGLPELQGALRAPWRHPLVGQRRRHPAHRGHRPAHQGAHGDRRRGVPGRGHHVHPRQGRHRRAVLRVVQLDAHALPHPRQAREQGPRRPVAVRLPRHDDRSRRPGRRPARPARRARSGRGHDRRLLHRQRAALEHLARRRHHAVPRREEHQLGGRLPGALRGALARPHPGRCGPERDDEPQRLVPHAAGRRRRRRHRRRSSRPAPS